MPMHDWTKVDAGICHAFHHRWISAISDALNSGLLPKSLYALPEQVAAGFSPDVLTLQRNEPPDSSANDDGEAGGLATATTRLHTRPRVSFMSQAEFNTFERKKSAIAIHHVSDDETVAMIEIVSPGNKSNRLNLNAFLKKTRQLLTERIHLMILDPFPPGPRDPNGVHALIWNEFHHEPFVLPPGKPLTLAAYECELTTRAYIEPIAVGDVLPDMPLFLEPNGCVMVSLEATYQAAFDVQPRRWRDVLQPPVRP